MKCVFQNKMILLKSASHHYSVVTINLSALHHSTKHNIVLHLLHKIPNFSSINKLQTPFKVTQRLIKKKIPFHLEVGSYLN